MSSAKSRQFCPMGYELTHWGRVTHICVSNLIIIGSDNGLSPGRRQAIIWTTAGILLIGPLGTNFSEILIEIHTFSFKKMRFKLSSGKWRPFCLGLNVLNRFLDCAGDDCFPCVQRGTVIVSRNTRREQLGSSWLHSTSSPDTMVVCRLLPNHYIIYCQNRMADMWKFFMMTSSNGNIFRVTGHLCAEFTGPRWIPHTKASDAELWCFLWSSSE